MRVGAQVKQSSYACDTFRGEVDELFEECGGWDGFGKILHYQHYPEENLINCKLVQINSEIWHLLDFKVSSDPKGYHVVHPGS